MQTTITLSFILSNLLNPKPIRLEPIAPPDSVIEILESQGVVKLRPSSLPNWRNLGGTHFLNVGDRIYTGENSFVRVKYLKHEKTFVTLGELMVLEVSRDPPLSSYLLKAIPSRDGDVVLPRDKNKDLSKADIMPFTDVADMGEGKTQDLGLNEERKTLQVEYPIEAIDALFPRGQIFFQGLNAPQRAHVMLPAGALQRGALYGTLWSLEPVKRPQWSVVISEKIFWIPIEDEGKYLFSASTLDGHVRLRPITLNFSKKMKSYLPSGVRRRDVVFVP